MTVFEAFILVFLRQSLSVTLKSVLELAFADQVGNELTDIHLPLPQIAGIKGMHHYCLAALEY